MAGNPSINPPYCMSRPHKIPRHLHGAIREADITGLSAPQIQTWLSENHKIVVGDDAISRLLKKLRTVPPTDGDGLTDLLAVRGALRADLVAGDWRQRHSAARLLVEIHQIVSSERREAELRLAELDEAQAQAHTKTYTVDASPDTWPEPTEPEPTEPNGPETPETQPGAPGAAQ